MTISGSPRRWLKAVAAVSALALLLALIGPRGELASAGPVAQASRSPTVDINNFAFHPPALTIAKGTTVTFSNSSKATHTATRDGAFDTGVIRPGRSVAARFKQKGSFAYHCEIHPRMRGRIVVG